MDTHGSDFVMALEGFWNGWASARKDILLIVCGSVTSWMLSKIVHNKGGLYNRLSCRIHLQPFTLRECEAYIRSRNIIMNRHQIPECYMIIGGIPYCWSNQVNMPQVNTWCGLAFERVCLQHVPQMKQALGISGYCALFFPGPANVMLKGVFMARYAIRPTLVTPYGIADGSYIGNIQNVITADDLFS